MPKGDADFKFWTFGQVSSLECGQSLLVPKGNVVSFYFVVSSGISGRNCEKKYNFGFVAL